QLQDGTTFSSTTPVFNRNLSFYPPALIARQQDRQGRLAPLHGGDGAVLQASDPAVPLPPVRAAAGSPGRPPVPPLARPRPRRAPLPRVDMSTFSNQAASGS